MGCGASSQSSTSAIAPTVSSAESITTRKSYSDQGECSGFRDNGNNFDEDESASAAAKAVNLIIRSCSPTETQLHVPSNPEDEQEQEGNVYEDEENTILKPGEDEGENLEDGSSETIVTPTKSPERDPTSKDYSQGVDDLLPKAAAAALEAIVKSAEDDVQAMKVVAAVAAVGDILFGGKEDMETKIEKCQSVVKTLAEVDVNAINGVLKTTETEGGYHPSGADENTPSPVIKHTCRVETK